MTSREITVTLHHSVDECDIRQRLVEYREAVLMAEFPWTRRDEGLLRRAMIDALPRHRPASVAEFHGAIPQRLILATDPAQIEAALPDVLALLRCLLTERSWRIGGVEQEGGE